MLFQLGQLKIGRAFLQAAAAWLLTGLTVGLSAATLTVQTNRLGSTPTLLAYGAGHFYPGSNTRDWWHYSGVTGARIFIGASDIEPSDDLKPVGDGVTNAVSFLARRSALRADPLNTNFIRWPYFIANYEDTNGTSVAYAYALREWRRLNVQVCAQITLSESRFPITDTNDWAGQWELWQHFYAQAFYLGNEFGVQRFQMFNEPDHSNANGLTQTNFLLRLQLASDAMQAAIADVNRLYGKTLTNLMLAPVSAASTYGSWGALVAANRHRNFLGQTDTNFSLVQQYDYHQYNSTPSGFNSTLTGNRAALAADLPGEAPWPLSLTEFNVHTAATFDTLTETLDTPSKYSRFGAIAANLLRGGVNELYAFKFSQTLNVTTVKKNGMHYVDNTNSPYNIGTITQAGEVWRLVNRGFPPGGDRLGVVAANGAEVLDAQAAYDPSARRYHLLSVNNTTSNLSLTVDLAAWQIPTSNTVLVEEVSETCHGAVKLWTNLPANGQFSLSHGSNSVLLLSASAARQGTVTNLAASEDATVKDGGNKNLNYGTATTLLVKNNSTNTSARNAAFIKFHLPPLSVSNLQAAVLTVRAASLNGADTVKAHVYGLTNSTWSQSVVKWANAPNLAQGVAAGVDYDNNFVRGAGDSAEIVGQLVAGSAAADRSLDVTRFLLDHPSADVSFLLAREVGFYGDAQDEDGMSLVSIEGDPAFAPRLLLIFNATNRPPVAVNDTAVTTPGFAKVVPVLANDSDPDGDPLTVISFTQGAHGTVVSNGDGTLSYTPAAGWLGADQFSYTATDGRGGNASANVSVTTAAGVTVWTNLIATAEANIRGGSYADTNVDEAAQGYLMVKYNTPDLAFARKAYFQFDLTGWTLSSNPQATLTVNFAANFTHRVQLWALTQAYQDFDADLTWNTAQANDKASNDLLTTGTSTATAIGASALIPTNGTTPYSFAISNVASLIRSNRLTLALSGITDSANNAGGLRLQRTNTTLAIPVVLPAPPAPPQVASISRGVAGEVIVRFLGAAGQIYLVEASAGLSPSAWSTVSTNVASADGSWTFTDGPPPAQIVRFFRARTP